MSLQVVIAACSKDIDRAVDLLEWCSQLGKTSHPCLLVCDPDVSWTDGVKALDTARKAFGEVECITLENHVDGWIPGSTALFKAAAVHCAGRPFFWVEPDAVPMRAGWVDEIEKAYAECQRPFMGVFVSHNNPAFPQPYMEGCGVYPADCWQRFEPIFNPQQSWTKWGSQVSVPNGFNTPLIMHLWGEAGNPPTFADRNVPGTNVFCLAQIPEQCALFHRAKDGSLIHLLRQKTGIFVPSNGMMVVFPFCEVDGAQFVRTVEWMAELNPHYPNEAVLSWDLGTSPGCVSRMKAVVGKCFSAIHQTAYPSPPKNEWAPSTAFRHTANYMTRFGRPWMWMEHDLIPLKPNWLEAMESEYFRMRKPFMAPLVPKMGHYNGTGIYPPNTPQLLAEAFTHKQTAWDTAAKLEMTGKTHDCSRLLQHVWGVQNGKFHPYLGNPPMFRNSSLMSQILPTSVLFHRCKDGSLIDRLRERKR